MNPFIEARNAEISSIPVTLGTKIPAIPWKGFQNEICTELQAVEWGNGNFGIGLVTGEVSRRLMGIDIEAGFMPRLGELAEAMKAAGVGDVFQSWINGYSEATPRGGLHILVRLEGEGKCPPSQVFAADAGKKVLIETRGEGGYILVAPTRGYVRGSGSFDQIVYCTLEEWGRVEAVLRSFDTQSTTDVGPPALTVAPRSTGAFDGMLGDSWITPVKAGLPSIRSLLEDRGWVFPGSSDQFGTHVVRPGKQPREGHSANLSHDGYLYVHSTNTDLPVGVGLDAVDIMWCWQHGRRDRAPTLDERTGWLQARRPPLQADAGAASGGGLEVADPNISTAPHIEDWFWDARPLFSAIRDSSMERGLSPDGVLGVWVSDYATTIPMGIWVAGPPARAPLNIFSVLVGSSGTGKTGSMRVAADLLGWNHNTNPNVLLGRGLRSGEGLCKLAQIPAKRGDDGPPAYRNAVQVAFDEGGVMSKQADRTGATMIPYLNTAWSGFGVVGGALSREIFEFPADLVRVCAVMGVQYGAAANLFEGEAARLGFPQRLLYFGLSHPGLRGADVTLENTEPAEPLDLPWWDHANHSQPSYLHFPTDIEHATRRWRQNKDHGDGIDDHYDAHQMNLTKRVAAVFCLADRRLEPNDQDWALASHVYETSRSIRRTLRASLKGVNMEQQRVRISEAVKLQDALEDRWVRTRAARIARHVHTQPDGCTLKDIKNRLDSSEKRRVHEMLTQAAASDWVIHKDDRYFAGGSQPAL